MTTELQIAEAKAADLRAKQIAHQRTHYEGDDMATPYDADLAKACREYAQAKEEAFWAEWTAEVFKQRREAWNNAVRATGSTKMTPATIAKLERETGIAVADLKRAKARYA